MKCLNNNCFRTLKFFSALIILVKVVSGDGFLSPVNEEIPTKRNSITLSLGDKFHSDQLYNELNRIFESNLLPISGNLSDFNVSNFLNQLNFYDASSLRGVSVNATFEGSPKENVNYRAQNFRIQDQQNSIYSKVLPKSKKNETILKSNDESLGKRPLNTTEEYLSEATNTDAQYHPVPKRIYVKHKGSASNPKHTPKVLMKSIPVPIRKSRKTDRSLNVAEQVDEFHSLSELSQIESQQHPRNSHSQIPRKKKKMKKRRKRLFKAKGRKNKTADESKQATSKSEEAEDFKLEKSAKKLPPKSDLEDTVAASHGVSAEDTSVPKDDAKNIDYYSILFGDHNLEEKINSKESREIPPSTYQHDANLYRQKPLHTLFGPPYDHYRSNYFPHHHSNQKTSDGEQLDGAVLLPPESVFQSTFYFSTPTPPTAITDPSSFYSLSTPRVFSHRSQSLVATSHSLQSPFDSPIPLIPYIPDFNHLSKISHHSRPIHDQRPSLFFKTNSENSFRESLESQKGNPKNTNDEEPYFNQDFGHHKNLQIEKTFNERTHHDVVTIGKSIPHHRKHHIFNHKQLKTNPEIIPKTSFSCTGRPPGMYADVEAECQVWHTCESDYRHHTFSCPNGTTFSQKLLTCDWWYNVKCEDSEQFLKVGPSAEVFKVIVKGKNNDRDTNIEEKEIREKSFKQTSRGRKKQKIMQEVSSENTTEENLAINEKNVPEIENEDPEIENEQSEKPNTEEEKGNINSEEEEKPEVDIKNIKSKEEDIYFPQVVPLVQQSGVLESTQEAQFNQNKPKLTPKFVEFIPYTGNSYPLFRLLKPGERRFVNKRQIHKTNKKNYQ